MVTQLGPSRIDKLPYVSEQPVIFNLDTMITPFDKPSDRSESSTSRTQSHPLARTARVVHSVMEGSFRLPNDFATAASSRRDEIPFLQESTITRKRLVSILDEAIQMIEDDLLEGACV